ncbi:MAG: rod-binding protein [Treponemataceae bacterium]|nr:rod-binding protein [Treponemataceae bacterium]
MTISQMAQMNTMSLGTNPLAGSYSSITGTDSDNKISEFQRLLERANQGISTTQVSDSGRLNGEYTSSLLNDRASTSDKNSKPQGFAANSASNSSVKGNIDRTSKLYEKSMELENFFVKMMLSSMRQTVQKSGLGGNDGYAAKMYEDMMYDELSVAMTKNAGFGLADQIYLSLAGTDK